MAAVIDASDPAWGVHFQVFARSEPVPTGTFRYATPFDELCRDEL
ncbi:hypothetical protein [Pseudonocardia sp. N23]|nr:hypothetical protein [Pseudonocardia sp. N23]GAY11956.1 hypothetical protein TOK_0342 [Pseudonocardia sp. N23]